MTTFNRQAYIPSEQRKDCSLASALERVLGITPKKRYSCLPADTANIEEDLTFENTSRNIMKRINAEEIERVIVRHYTQMQTPFALGITGEGVKIYKLGQGPLSRIINVTYLDSRTEISVFKCEDPRKIESPDSEIISLSA